MKKVVLSLATLAAALPTLSFAEDASPLSFNVGAVSEYRYRGISQSRLKPAVQGGVDYAFSSGFYLGAWASSIKWIKDATGDAPAEIDLYGGYKGDIVKDSLSYDVGVLSYQYPSHKLSTSPVTYEVYGALTYGPATVKYSHSVSNLFGVADSKNSGYLDLSASFDVGGGITLAPHVGYQRVAGNSASGNSNLSYTDYALGVSKDFSGLVVSATVVYADTKKPGGVPAYYYAPKDKNLGKTALVLGVKYTF